MNITVETIKSKLLEPQHCISDTVAEKLSAKLAKCVDSLKPNIAEWIGSKPFSDIWIRDKYCLNAVLKIRGNPTSPLAIADAILALNAYAENIANEHLIWQKRM